MDIERLLSDARPRLDRLETQLDQMETGVLLDQKNLRELVGLYHAVCEDFLVARSLTANPQILARFEAVASRAYRFVHAGSLDRGSWRRSLTWVIDLLVNQVPSAAQACRIHLITAASAMLIGAILAFILSMWQPHFIGTMIPQGFLSADVQERVEKIEKEPERISTLAQAAMFSVSLFTHNFQVSVLAFGLGMMTVIGGVWVLMANGVILGAIAAQYLQAGESTFFLAWVGPHGAWELPAIVVAGAIGLRCGTAFWTPGDRGRLVALREALPQAGQLLAAVVVLLCGAGLIEGSFSQFSTRLVSYPFKITLAIILFAVALAWLSGLLRRPEKRETL